MNPSQNQFDRIGIIVLAAGGSIRFGRPKQLLKYHGESLVRRAITAAINTNAGPVIVSLGAEHEAIENEIANLEVTAVFNPDWRSGMSSSLITALRYMTDYHGDIRAVIFMLCDQPEIDAAKLNKLMDAFEATGASIVASEYNETLGVPALFDRSMFAELMRLNGDQGARSVIRKNVDRVARVSMPEAAFDIDSPVDIESL